jgi:hypothetical protein
MVMNAIPINYGEFYDFPRMIRFLLDEQWYFLRSYFDEEKDDYTDWYEVYLLPYHSEDEFMTDPNYWKDLTKALHLGQIPIAHVGLDETRRKSIDGDKMETWLSARKQEIGGMA